MIWPERSFTAAGVSCCQRYREGQEDQLGALGLVVNVLVLWNTVYMQAALDQLRKQSGHKTDVMLNRYIRDGRLFARNR